MLVYFSSVSGNTARFIEKVGLPAVRIPLRPRLEGMIEISEPAVLVIPTYGAGPATKAVPPQVKEFLNIPGNRDRITGVIGTGNKNFGEGYGLAADIVAAKLGVPVLYKLEIFGEPHDVETVRAGVKTWLADTPSRKSST